MHEVMMREYLAWRPEPIWNADNSQRAENPDIIQIINTDGMLMRHSVRSGVKKKPLQAKYPGHTMLHSVRSGVKNKPLRAKYPGHTLTAPFENKAETKPNCGSSPIPSP